MKYAIILLVSILCVTLSYGAEEKKGKVAWNSYCNGLNCPPFTVLYENKTANVTYRKYESSLWARTNVTSISYEKAVNIGFHRLFNYISGDNVANKAIPMTAPVSVEVIPGQGAFCNSTFIIGFYVPFSYQAKVTPPPAPTSSNVYLQRIEPTLIAAYGYSGFVNSWKEDVAPEATYLASFLTEQGNVKFNPNLPFTAGYDSPFRLFNRHNEIWYPISTIM